MLPSPLGFFALAVVASAALRLSDMLATFAATLVGEETRIVEGLRISLSSIQIPGRRVALFEETNHELRETRRA